VALIGRGEIWGARLKPNQGAEVGKVRPVVVPLTTLTDPELAALEQALRGVLGLL